METLARKPIWISALATALLLAAAWQLWHSRLAQSAIDESSYVRIGGIEQYIRIVGEDRANPVLLFVHGGPGRSVMGLSQTFRPWERYFTIVLWDQRGTGRTYIRNGEERSAPLTIERMTRDGVELAQYLTHHLHGKIVVVGHSWGSILGVRMVQARPDLFTAYVGTGQFVNKTLAEQIAYQALLAKARAAQDTQTVTELQRLLQASEAERQQFVARQWAQKYSPPAERAIKANLMKTVLDASNSSPAETQAIRDGIRLSVDRLSPQIAVYDIRSSGLDFAVPFFVIQGDEDSQTPAILARQYFDAVRAPAKTYIALKGGGHFAVITMSDAFLDVLVEKVRPLTVPSNDPAQRD
jgi:pimeloyl-ACP methyl ester carboxylesterase